MRSKTTVLFNCMELSFIWLVPVDVKEMHFYVGYLTVWRALFFSRGKKGVAIHQSTRFEGAVAMKADEILVAPFIRSIAHTDF